MKQIWLNLKTKEHQHALLTVSIVFMSSILFFLLASLKAPIKAEQKTELPLEISAFEISPSVNTNSNTASNAPKQQEASIPAPDLKAKTSEETNVNDFLSFSTTGNESLEDIFGKDGVDFQSNVPIVSNRTVLKAPTFDASTQEEGTIGLYIWVDADGKVMRTALNPEASNSGSVFLIQLAKKAALTMQFDSKPNAAIECAGTSIFVFKKG